MGVLRLGYPCLNRSIGCSSARGFRLKSWSGERLLAAAEGNLACLERILRFNLEQGLLFFRLSSDLVPFASHPVNRVDWGSRLASRFAAIGGLVRSGGMRISMHPDQFTLINSPDPGIFERSAAELDYHAEVLERMGLDDSARIQVHVGGVYGDKPAAIRRFAERFDRLGAAVRRRLTIENDDRLFTVQDCLEVSAATGVPVLFDTFHHELNPGTLRPAEAAVRCAGTWSAGQGPFMLDYSSQLAGERRGRHAESIDLEHFDRKMAELDAAFDFDCMLEIKDKEASALRLREHLRRG